MHTTTERQQTIHATAGYLVGLERGLAMLERVRDHARRRHQPLDILDQAVAEMERELAHACELHKRRVDAERVEAVA